MTPCRLQCWPVAGSTDALEVWAEATRCHGQLTLQYRLSWSLTSPAVLVPLRASARAEDPAPQRRDGLWQHTCFEAFLAPLGGGSYWELNLSPSGDWNLYRFAAYRSGQQPEERCPQLPFTVMGPRPAPSQTNCQNPSVRVLLALDLCCPLPPELAHAPQLELGLTAVIEQVDGVLSYWALNHPGPEPDFHDRRGWSLRL
jgi:hypothetical protein